MLCLRSCHSARPASLHIQSRHTSDNRPEPLLSPSLLSRFSTRLEGTAPNIALRYETRTKCLRIILCAGLKADPGFPATLVGCSGSPAWRWTGTESRSASYRISFRLEAVAARRKL